MKKINKHIRLSYLILAPVLVAILFLGSCKEMESNIDIISNDKTKPDVVTNVRVENINGGARISYTLPNSKNLLYVLARYPINDNRIRETKSSYYTDTILVDGFALEKEYEVTLYAVSRANVMSDPVVVKVNPQTPNYLLINSNIEITPDFGGANFYGLNPNKVPVAVHLLAFNENTNQYDEQDPEYISSGIVNVSMRGFDAVPRKFGVYTTDRFGNKSDTIFKTLTPLFETLLDKSKFFTYNLPSDAIIGFGWEFHYFFDGRIDGNGWHTVPTPNGKTIGTFGLGVNAKISRLVVWQRPTEYFANQNTRTFTIWGSASDAPQDMLPPRNSPEGTVVGDWVNMGNFTFPNPASGSQPNQATQADHAIVAQGVNFTMPSIAPKVKFIRFETTQTWGGLNYVNAMEISVYGDPL